MRAVRWWSCASVVLALGASAGVARADPNDVALNGVFAVLSDGQFAKTNDRFHDEPSVASRWTIASACESFQDCRGTVSSDLGWTADVVFQSNVWKVVRTLEGWEPCPDGHTVAGRQILKFWVDPDRPGRYTGFDTTTGPSGACDVNRTLVVELPLTLIPV